MSQTALAQFLGKAVVYEEWRVPFDARLRLAAIISAAILGAGFVNLLLLPSLEAWTYSEFFMFGSGEMLRGMLTAAWDMLPWLMGAIVLGLVAYFPLLYYTDQLQTGHTRWHNLATAEVVLGSLFGLLIGVEAVIILLNLVAWIVAIILAGAFLLGALAGMGSR